MRHLVILSAGERISATRSDLQGYVLRFGSLSLFLNRDALNRLESALRGAEDTALAHGSASTGVGAMEGLDDAE